MYYYHMVYLDDTSVAEIEIRVDPWITWTHGLVLDLYVTDLGQVERQIFDKVLEHKILAECEDELFALAYSKEDERIA